MSTIERLNTEFLPPSEAVWEAIPSFNLIIDESIIAFLNESHLKSFLLNLGNCLKAELKSQYFCLKISLPQKCKDQAFGDQLLQFSTWETSVFALLPQL